MITFIVCSHDEDDEYEGLLKDRRLLERASEVDYKIRVCPKPSNSFFRKELVAPLLKDGYITEENWDKVHTYEKDGIYIEYKFVNEVREELKDIEFENNGQS